MPRLPRRAGLRRKQPSPPPSSASAPVLAIAAPCCARSSRPRSLEVNALDCVARHISAKARQHDRLHAQLHRCLHANPSTGRPTCPGCDGVFENRLELFRHLAAATDAAHLACKQVGGQPAEQEGGAQAHRPQGPRAGTAEAWPGRKLVRQAAAEAARAAGRSEEAARRSAGRGGGGGLLYAAAKMGGSRGIWWVRALRRGRDLERRATTGFTALMTAAEAGHAVVVTLLRTVPTCHVDAKNAYGQAAIHFAAQNGRSEAVDALLMPAEAVLTAATTAAEEGGGEATAAAAAAAAEEPGKGWR